MDYKNLTEAIKEFGDESIKFAQIKLRTKGFAGKKYKTNNTGNLSKGLEYQVKETEKGLVLEFLSKEAYGIFIEEGVNGTELKRGSKYSFKGKFVNIEAIEKYVKSGKFRLKKVYTNKEGNKVNTFVAKTPENVKSAAFAIARYLALNGIKGIGYMSKGMEQAWENMEPEANKALAKDLSDFMYLDFKNKGFNVTQKST
jgi:hypothetical protein